MSNVQPSKQGDVNQLDIRFLSLSDTLRRSGPSQIHKQQPVNPSAYQQSLDAGTQPPQLSSSSVRYWSDFSRVYYHPKSLVQLYDFELHSPTMPFDRFSMGAELFGSLNRDHDIVDRDWRPFVEECDRMQGIQVFTATDDGWGGFASSYLEALRDEYPKSCIWVWGLQSPLLDTPRAQRQQRLANTAQSLHQLCTQASMVTPLAIPEDKLPSIVNLDRRSTWHVSALLATAAESATLQSRLTGTSDKQVPSLAELAERLNTGGNQTLSRTQMAVGEPGEEELDLFQVGWTRGEKKKSGQLFGQISSFRGTARTDDEDAEGQSQAIRHTIGSPVLSR